MSRGNDTYSDWLSLRYVLLLAIKYKTLVRVFSYRVIGCAAGQNRTTAQQRKLFEKKLKYSGSCRNAS